MNNLQKNAEADYFAKAVAAAIESSDYKLALETCEQATKSKKINASVFAYAIGRATILGKHDFALKFYEQAKNSGQTNVSVFGGAIIAASELKDSTCIKEILSLVKKSDALEVLNYVRQCNKTKSHVLEEAMKDLETKAEGKSGPLKL